MVWIPVSEANLVNKALSHKRNFYFAKEMVLVPICHFELQRAVTSTPIVFVPFEKTVRPVSVLGLEISKNLFLGSNGAWRTDYLPSALTAHPFSLLKLDNGTQCMGIRQDSDILVEKDKGEPFFNRDGEEGTLLKQYKNLLISILRDGLFTTKACSLLEEFELLQPFKPKFKKINGESFQIDGLLSIDQKKFASLEEKKFLKLRETVAIDLIYASIFSLPLFNSLIRLMNHPEAPQSVTNEDGAFKELGENILGNNEDKLNFDF